MSLIRLYLDEDAEQRALVDGLRARGMDVLTAFEAGMVGRTDREQLEFAIERERTIYSLNVRDFANLHKEYLQASEDHFGIVLIPSQRYGVGEKIRRLVSFVNAKSAAELHNQIEFL